MLEKGGPRYALPLCAKGKDRERERERERERGHSHPETLIGKWEMPIR